jgi:hypothetical protein
MMISEPLTWLCEEPVIPPSRQHFRKGWPDVANFFLLPRRHLSDFDAWWGGEFNAEMGE